MTDSKKSAKPAAAKSAKPAKSDSKATKPAGEKARKQNKSKKGQPGVPTPAPAETLPAQGASDSEISIDQVRGHGDETRQQTTQREHTMTTAQGIPMADDQNSQRIGERGPVLLQDFALRDKLFHFDHERIPERVVHARGYGARGYFEAYESLSDITMADPFQEAGRRTEAFARFSTVAGNLGSPDLPRDIRGFAVKLYTQQGNWDIVGNNAPVFFVQDAMKFPDLVHSVKEEPDRGWPQAASAHDTFWDFISLTPESTHTVFWLMSDRAIPRSFRMMEGFGVHPFRFINEAGKSSFVKFHWKPVLGMQSVVWNEAVKINGADSDFHRRDLYNSIDAGDPAEWELGIQVFDEEFADSFEFDILDPTKIIPEEQVPVRIVGKLVLDQVVDNVFAEIEQVAFCTQNIVPGIDFTNDPLLQGRNFSYLDTQLKRLGSPNFTHIPVNAPRCPVMNFQRDGHMTTTRPSGRAFYEPNTLGSGENPRENPEIGFTPYAAQESGEIRALRAESFADHYSQALQFYNSQTEVEQEHIIDAFVFELSKVETPEIRERMLANLRNVGDVGEKVAEKLGMDLPEKAAAKVPTRTDLPQSDALSILKSAKDTIQGRKVGALINDGTDAALLTSLTDAVEKAGAMVELVGPKVGGVKLSTGDKQPLDQLVDGGPSVLYDAVALVLSEDGAADLVKNPAAKDFVNDAFNHYKVIAATDGARPLIDILGDTSSDDGVLALQNSSVSEFLDKWAAGRVWGRPIG
ncbi:catalase [Blastococcus sp. Marseille-P5729]|uniref:catalase n=1 Tax=Blastococcus sp. Marseille-P5729 TaxID=2086582 RepID=UPI000D109C16|nr:catalase [Blastococcus sp. Marseille-P5729]